MSSSGWLGKIKSGAKSMQETAKNRLEKLSETLDQKVKEAREDLERQRQADVSASALPTMQRWRPSSDNPDGEIISEVKTLPVEQPTFQSSLPSSSPSVALPEIPEASALVQEPITIPRKSGSKRHSTRTSDKKNVSSKQTDTNEQLTQSISETTPTSISQEITNDNLNIVSSKEASNDELIRSTSATITSEQKTVILSTTDSQLEIAQIKSTTDVSNLSVNSEISSIEQPDLQSTVLNISDNKEIPLTIDSCSEIVSINETVNQIPVSVNVESEGSHDQSKMEDSTTKYIMAHISDDKSYTATDINNPLQTHSDAEQLHSNASNDTISMHMNIIDATVEQSSPIEIPDDRNLSTTNSNIDNISNNLSIDKPLTSTHDSEIPIEHSDTENSKTEILDYQQPVSTDTNDIVLQKSDSLERSSLTTYTDLPIINATTESLSTDRLSDKISASTQNNESSAEQFNSQHEEKKISDFAQLISTNIDSIVVEKSDSSETSSLATCINIPIMDSTTASTSTDILTRELSTSPYNDDIPTDQYNNKHKESEIPDYELATATDTEKQSTGPSDVITVSDEKTLLLMDTTDLPITDAKAENDSIDKSENVSTEFAYSDDIPTDQYNSEHQEIEISNYELPTKTNIEEQSAEQSDTIKMLDEERTLLTDTTDLPSTDVNVESNSIDQMTTEFSTSKYSDDIPGDQYNAELQETETLDYELRTKTDIDQPSVENVTVKSFARDFSFDKSMASKKNNRLFVEEIGSKDMPTKVFDDELQTADDNVVDIMLYSPNQEDILKNVPINVLSPLTENNDTATKYTDSDENISMDKSIDVPKTYIQFENISLDISDDELPATAAIINSSNIISDSKNMLMNIPDEELPTLTDNEQLSNTKSDQENILMYIPDDQLPNVDNVIDSSNANYDIENILMTIPDDELPTVEIITDLPVINSTRDNILMSIPDYDLPTIDSTSENFQMILTDAKLPVSTKMDEMTTEYSSPDSITIDTRDDNDDDDDDDELFKFTPTNSAPIEQFQSKNKSSISTNELEDSFEELNTSDIPVQRVLIPPTQEIPQLTSLRELISKIEDDDNHSDDENIFLPSKQTKIIIPEETKLNTENKTLNSQTIPTTRSSSSSASISDDAPDDLFDNPSVSNHSISDVSSTNNIVETLSTVSLESKSIEKKRSSIVNSHSIPGNAKLLQITCSSIYIYLCTTERKIFYAKFDSVNLNQSYNWQLHTDLAEQLFISNNNQTVWRLHNKILYSSNDPIKYPPLGSHWSQIKLNNDQPYLSMSINDQCGWYIKADGTLWLLRTNDRTSQSINVPCPFNLNRVFCFGNKIGVSASDGQILIRTGCTNDEPEGTGWIFIEPNLGLLDDFVILTNSDTVVMIDEKHRLWMHQWVNDDGFYEILCDDNLYTSNERHLISVNSNVLCFSNCKNQIHLFSDCLIGVKWKLVEKNTRLQRLIGAFSNEDYVWALTTDRSISSSNGKIFRKPHQVKFLTHATFVPNNSSKKTILWSLDESCGIYMRPDLADNTEWEEVSQIQFESRRRLINIVCSNSGVWAVDDQGQIYFRHGHISASQQANASETTFLPPAWIKVPGEPERRRSFTQVYCGPAEWMVYAMDNKQTVYTRVDISTENRIGTSWKVIEDCSALELALSEHTLWLLTSLGEIQCRENISLSNPIGTRSTTLSGRFLSLTVSMDDSQIWALDSRRNLLKLDRLTVTFEK